jgi:hypothetical protein
MRTILAFVALAACAPSVVPSWLADAPVAPEDAPERPEVAADAAPPPDAPEDAAAEARPAGCAAGRVTCGAACVDIAVDALNCGACGMPCDFGVACVAGRCAVPPPPDAAAVADAGRPCDAASQCGTLRAGYDRSCQGGQCVDVCPPRSADCDGDIANGCETNTTINGNCGACGVACRGTCRNSAPNVWTCF